MDVDESLLGAEQETANVALGNAQDTQNDAAHLALSTLALSTLTLSTLAQPCSVWL